jgi:hypothetical protein
VKDHLPEHPDHQRERSRSQTERALNAERINDKCPLKLKQRVILGVILGSFFFLVVGCWYWVGLDKPKIDRSDFNFKHQPEKTTP